MALFIIALLISAQVLAAESSPVGLWKTVDDRTQQPRGSVRIYVKDGALFGKIESTLDPKEAAERCIKCSDDRRDKPVIGLEILRDMRKKDTDYRGGYILDPDTGTVYRCKMSLEDGGRRLVLRGFIGISLLGRSQTWFRQE